MKTLKIAAVCLLGFMSSAVLAKPTCQGYLGVDGYERGMGRAVYLGKIEDRGNSGHLTLQFIDGTESTESAEYSCDFTTQRCLPITDGVTNYFPTCIGALKSSRAGQVIFWLRAYPDSECRGLEANMVGNIVCR